MSDVSPDPHYRHHVGNVLKEGLAYLRGECNLAKAAGHALTLTAWDHAETDAQRAAVAEALGVSTIAEAAEAAALARNVAVSLTDEQWRAASLRAEHAAQQAIELIVEDTDADAIVCPDSIESLV